MLLLIDILMIAGIELILIGLFALTYRGMRLNINSAQTQAKKKKIIDALHKAISHLIPFSKIILAKLKLEKKIKDKIDAAHIKSSPEEFFNIKILLPIALGIVTFVFLKEKLPVAVIIAILFGYVLPDFWLKRKIAQRKYTISRVLPEVIDLLGLCLEAGLDFTASIQWMIDKTPFNPLTEELAFVLQEIKWGKPRTTALRDMSKRLNISEVSSFVQMIIQAERLGTPIVDAFAILSEDTRLQRFHRGERYAMQAPIKILIPLIFCILPVIGIIVGGPILLRFMLGDIFKGMM